MDAELCSHRRRWRVQVHPVLCPVHDVGGVLRLLAAPESARFPNRLQVPAQVPSHLQQGQHALAVCGSCVPPTGRDSAGSAVYVDVVLYSAALYDARAFIVFDGHLDDVHSRLHPCADGSHHGGRVSQAAPPKIHREPRSLFLVHGPHLRDAVVPRGLRGAEEDSAGRQEAVVFVNVSLTRFFIHHIVPQRRHHSNKKKKKKKKRKNRKF
mmetsp:Transcript_7588/g.20695  ORF Transcript_7588/g.20695 Transcript_7588/m.20695 type:complete len:210 (-) Transcript_7588:200-829(-)